MMRQDLATIIRFLCVGGLGAILFVVLAILLSEFGVAGSLAGALSYSFCVPVMYWSQQNITFAARPNHLKSFPRYLLLQLAGFTLSWLLPLLLGSLLPLALVFVLVSIGAAMMNFILMKIWVFKD